MAGFLSSDFYSHFPDDLGCKSTASERAKSWSVMEFLGVTG